SCAEADTPCSQVVKKALDCRRWDEKDMKDAVEAEMSVVVPRFEHLLTPLGTISNIATLLGLLGTVTENIKAFGVLGAGGTMGDPAILAGAIAEALVTTVAGLIVSIPSVIFYNYFISRVNRRIAEMENNVTNVVIKLTGRVK
ncbi:MAG: MotA/TolQ/ExbB proton channel family protein, partial [Treponema porcinum]|uniref:MotA/TolQ/ExbB proton channel family protein n=1 Tax=Treponema porcinum TaxID=261392 RepID=UPI002A7FCF64